jgi:thioredoxin 1
MQVVTKDELNQLLQNSDTPVFVDYFAEWCGPCKMLAPIIEKIAPEFEGKVKIVKVDIDDQTELAQEQKVSSIPTLISYKDGKEAERIVGFQSEDALRKTLQNLAQ